MDAVFLHANGFNAGTYRQLLAPLAERCRILAVDQRGHGGSTLPTSTDARSDWLDLRDDLLAFLAVLGLQKVVLAGHSMGGTVSLLAAAEAPDRCRRLVLVDPVVLPPGQLPKAADSPLVEGARRRRAAFPDRAAAFAAYRGRGAFATWPDEVLADYVQAGFRDLDDGTVTLACAPAWEASGFSSQGHDTWGALARSRCPIHALRAETASTFHLGPAETVAGGRLRIETVSGSSHFLPMERPEEVRRALAAAILGEDPPEAGRAGVASAESLG